MNKWEWILKRQENRQIQTSHINTRTTYKYNKINVHSQYRWHGKHIHELTLLDSRHNEKSTRRATQFSQRTWKERKWVTEKRKWGACVVRVQRMMLVCSCALSCYEKQRKSDTVCNFYLHERISKRQFKWRWIVSAWIPIKSKYLPIKLPLKPRLHWLLVVGVSLPRT